jgi:hypothetical protein
VGFLITKETFKIIEETIQQMVVEHDGDLLLIPHMDEIARRAEVSDETLKEYFRFILFAGEDSEEN